MRGEQRELLGDLGYQASDILQSNAAVWVEGPSDRILEALADILPPLEAAVVAVKKSCNGRAVLSPLLFPFLHRIAADRDLAQRAEANRRASRTDRVPGVPIFSLFMFADLPAPAGRYARTKQKRKIGRDLCRSARARLVRTKKSTPPVYMMV